MSGPRRRRGRTSGTSSDLSIGTRPIRISSIPPSRDTSTGSVFSFDTNSTTNENIGKVHLMTIHAAKGLEYNVVFLAGVEEGILPHQRSVEENDGSVEEERRLFYVAITRARERLLMTSCRRRHVQNEVVEATPSPFIGEIPAELLVNPGTEPSAGIDLPEDPFAALKAKFT